eukprot:4702-Heterococcus_DN1.PRE.13
MRHEHISGHSDQPRDPSMAAHTSGMHLYFKLFTRTSPASAGAAYTETVRPIYTLKFDVASTQALLLVVATRHTYVDKLQGSVCALPDLI